MGSPLFAVVVLLMLSSPETAVWLVAGYLTFLILRTR